MAIDKNILKRSLIINLENGTASGGAQKVKTRTYNNIKAAATAAALHAVGTALAALMAKPLLYVGISEKAELAVEEEE